MGFATGNRKSGLFIFFFLLALLLIYSPLMRVYYEGKPIGVKVSAVDGNGERSELELPVAFQGVHRSFIRTERAIAAFVLTEEGKSFVNPGSHLEWELYVKAPDEEEYQLLVIRTHERDA